MDNEKIGRTFMQTLNAMGYNNSTKTIEDRLASVGLSAEQVIRHYQQDPVKSSDTSKPIFKELAENIGLGKELEQKEESETEYEYFNKILTKLFVDLSKAKALAVELKQKGGAHSEEE